MTGSAPRVSVLLLAYQQELTVEAAVQSILTQDIGEPMEVLLSDDASTDSTHGRLVECARRYTGPHQVRVLRNARNLGIAGHYNALVDIAQGELLVTAAGDDVSSPQRVRRLLEAWDATGGRVDLVASDLWPMDAQGRNAASRITVDRLERWRDARDWCRQRPYIVGAGHAFTKRLFSRFGPMETGLVNEDQILTLRALTSGGAITVSEPLVGYRSGGVSSARVYRSGTEFLSHQRVLYQRRRAELHQMRADAVISGWSREVHLALSADWRRNEFIGRLAQGQLPFWRAVLERDVETLPWRLRKGLYFKLPALACGSSLMRRGRSAWSATLATPPHSASEPVIA